MSDEKDVVQTAYVPIPRCEMCGSRLVLNTDGSKECPKCGFFIPAPITGNSEAQA
jgi:predicted RNA-binding Zn-ribbon protein involved in translation (DUF1610 family)